jgi:CDP-paratose 2-epimerase
MKTLIAGDFVRPDVRQGEELAGLFRQHRDAGRVLHLAAQVAVTTSVTAPNEDFEINALGTLNVLEAMPQSGMAAPLLYSSTNKVYGEMTEVGVVERGLGQLYHSVAENRTLFEPAPAVASVLSSAK